jgi:hypothetical protein
MKNTEKYGRMAEKKLGQYRSTRDAYTVKVARTKQEVTIYL